MSASDDFPFSVDQQKALISADLNATLLLQFLFGIYTGLFPATMYIYIHKENRTRSKDRIIIGNITALYTSTTLYLSSNWIYTNILFCAKGTTRINMFIESLTGDMPSGERIIAEVISFVVFLFADGLLVWRCFHACGRSFRKSLLSIVLLAVETVLVLTAILYRCLIDARPDFETVQADEIFNRLTAAAFVAVVATSFVSTVVICLQIWRHISPSSRSRKHYQTIINILIESSALYTVTVLLSAILNFAGSATSEVGNIESTFDVLLISNFVSGTTQIIIGLAPTLMIARLFVSSGQEDTEFSSAPARLPSNLISCASHSPDLESQQWALIGADEQESEKIQVVPRNEDHGQPGDDIDELQDKP